MKNPSVLIDELFIEVDQIITYSDLTPQLCAWWRGRLSGIAISFDHSPLDIDRIEEIYTRILAAEGA